MKKVLSISIVCLLFIAMNVTAKPVAAPEAKPEAVEQTAVLRGMILDNLTNETLAGAIITANGQKIYSDLDGNFSISNLCGEKCQLKINLISYKEQTIDIDVRNPKALKIKLQQR